MYFRPNVASLQSNMCSVRSVELVHLWFVSACVYSAVQVGCNCRLEQWGRRPGEICVFCLFAEQWELLKNRCPPLHNMTKSAAGNVHITMCLLLSKTESSPSRILLFFKCIHKPVNVKRTTAGCHMFFVCLFVCFLFFFYLSLEEKRS